MKFEIENNVIASYKRLSYEPWYAFAEFVDNSTQSYFDNKEILDKEYNRTGEKLAISIDYDRNGDTITIIDNSFGMNEVDLNRAFKVGQPPENPDGRSKYGLGMKTAACWFGDLWSIETKKFNEEQSHLVTIDVDAIAKHVGEVNLNVISKDCPKDKHFTIIKITKLNRTLVGRTLGKIRNHLRSIYRFDILDGIEIKWNGNILDWRGYLDELHVTSDGVRFKKVFEFEINGKQVKGWVGVLGKGNGSRSKAGFSIIQNRRIIQDNYKPISIYGEQEDGGNDLINQRVLGELALDGFSVSHTKDKIVWEDDDEEILNDKLGEICKEARELALTLRYNREEIVDNKMNIFKESAVTILEGEFKSYEIKNYITTVQPYPEKIITASFEKNIDRVKVDNTPNLEVNIGTEEDKIIVTIYFSEKSEFEPYVLTETTIEEFRVVVIINLLHPHIQEMENEESFTNFIRHCVYDGVAEWKALRLRGSLQPSTIKFIKDGLLRVPYEIKINKV